MLRDIYTEDHEAFRDTVRQFVGKEIVPYIPEWEAAGIVPRELYTEGRRNWHQRPADPRGVRWRRNGHIPLQHRRSRGERLRRPRHWVGCRCT